MHSHRRRPTLIHFARVRNFWLWPLLSVFFAASAETRANEVPVPRPDDPPAIQRWLNTLSPRPPFGLPCKGESCRAEDIDKLLDALAGFHERFPQLRKEIERIVLGWNYCSINYGNVPHNLEWRNNRIVVRPSPSLRSHSWCGFRRWGLTIDDSSRIVPDTLANPPLRGRFLAHFRFRILHQQCFADPDTGLTPFDKRPPMYSGPEHPGNAADPSFILHTPRCGERSTNSALPEERIPEHAPPARKAVKHPAPRMRPSLGKQPHGRRSPDQAKRLIRSPQSGWLTDQQRHQHLSLQLRLATKLSEKTAFRSNKSRAWNAKPPGDIPLDSRFPVSIHVLPDAKLARFRIDGRLFQRYRLRDGQWLTGLGLQWSPYPFVFLRGSVEIPENHPANSLTPKPVYTWGVGYSDWRPGGWSFEINQWEPVNLRNKPRTDRFEYKIGFNPDYSSLDPRLSGHVAATWLGGKPSIWSYWTWNFGHGWFARGGLAWSAISPVGLQWIYGFGRWHWKEGSINLYYENWGPNRAFRPNFRRNGDLILEWRFGF
ncbi:hypothetical protein D6833_06995 [Candidatus Parcubacteria bacterium]|nr:MAG: hypothetical protein D6833_06995 [Candidatus Parcubacteria bacterium]